MSQSDSHLRKRKTDSSLNMGNAISSAAGAASNVVDYVARKFRRTEDGQEVVETPSSSKVAEKAEEAQEAPTSWNVIKECEAKAGEAPATPKTAAKGAPSFPTPLARVTPLSAKANSVVSSPSVANDDGPPALARQDDGPREELPLDATPESSPEPAKEKAKRAAAGDAEESEEDAKEVQEERAAAGAEEQKEEQKEAKVLQKQSSSSSLPARRRKKTIEDMGYRFNEEGKLRSIEGDAAFKFTTQKAYEELGDIIGDLVYELMEDMGLRKQYLEVGRNRRFYFVSPDYELKERILVLIHGSGVVKAGQWARKLIINESLERGTQLGYIKRALALDWGVVVLNYNEKCVGQADRCHAPDAHGREEWAHALAEVEDSELVVVAHSYGGSIISDAVRRMTRDGDDRVLVVGLTDSWFSEGKDVFAINWNTQKRGLHRTGGTWQMYSGDGTHEGTSAACINAAFAVLEGVQGDTTVEEFHDLLEDSERIIKAEYKAKNAKKEQGDTVSAKSLELEGAKEDKEERKNGEKKKDEVKEKKEEEDKEDEEEKKEEEEVKDEDVMEDQKENAARKEDEEVEVKEDEVKMKKEEEEEKEKKAAGDVVEEQKKVVDVVVDHDDNEVAQAPGTIPPAENSVQKCVASSPPKSD